ADRNGADPVRRGGGREADGMTPRGAACAAALAALPLAQAVARGAQAEGAGPRTAAPPGAPSGHPAAPDAKPAAPEEGAAPAPEVTGRVEARLESSPGPVTVGEPVTLLLTPREPAGAVPQVTNADPQASHPFT